MIMFKTQAYTEECAMLVSVLTVLIQVDAVVCAYGDIKLNEAHPGGDTEDFIELINIGSEACSLEGWGIAKDAEIVDPRGVAFRPGRSIFECDPNVEEPPDLWVQYPACTNCCCCNTCLSCS